MDELHCEEGLEFYEDVLESITCLTLFSPQISPDMWSFFPRMIEAFHKYVYIYTGVIIRGYQGYQGY